MYHLRRPSSFSPQIVTAEEAAKPLLPFGRVERVQWWIFVGQDDSEILRSVLEAPDPFPPDQARAQNPLPLSLSSAAIGAPCGGGPGGLDVPPQAHIIGQLGRIDMRPASGRCD